jgi:hypothetical protein
MTVRIITAMSIEQIPTLLLIVAVMLAPYGVSALLTHYFPTLARGYGDVRRRLPDPNPPHPRSAACSAG